ncbi:ABC transporter substrate-binding protein [soil metagenome]
MASSRLTRPISSRARVIAVPAALAIAGLGSLRYSASAQDKTTVKLRSSTSSGAETDLYNQIIADASAALPDLDIQNELVTSDYITKLQTDIAAGTGPDLFFLDSLPAPNFAASGALLPIDDYMAASGVAAADFYPGLLAPFQYNGQTFGLPKDWSALGMVYDTDALTAAGVTAVPTNWDELKAAGQALLEATGSPRIMITTSFDRYLAFHYAAGASVLSDDGTQITINSPEAEAALTFYYGLYNEGIATTPADAGAEWPGDGLAKDLADIVFEGNWVVPFLTTGAPDLKYAVAEMPEGPGGKATLAFTVAYAINATTNAADGAWALENYLVGVEGMTKWASLGLAMPTRPALADAWSQQFPDRAAFLAGGDYARGWAFGVGGQAFNDDVNAEIQGLFAGQQDVQTTLQHMEEIAHERITLSESTPVASPTA